MKRRTKIIATIGPASSSVTVLTRMIKAGMNVARLNFSHGDYKEHAILMRHIRQASKKAGQPVAILQDLQGPKIRLGVLPVEGVNIKKGEIVKFQTGIEHYKTGGALPVTYDNLHKDVKTGERLFLDDGLIETEITAIRGKVISAKVKNGGHLSSHKGINVPDSKISTSSFTEKDHEDLLFGLENEVDWVALSFVTTPAVVMKVRDIIRAKCRALKTVAPRIVVKIERQEAVERFLDILNVADGVMIARGDLGVSLRPEEVPVIQKEFVEICRQTGKPVIVATHMLQSMTDNPRATRAEVSDVANAVIDHTDATMLSGESATGKYPDVSVQTMAAVIDEAEASMLDDISFYQIHDVGDIPTAIAQTLHVMVENGQIDLIASSSTYHAVADAVNIFRPNVPIILACPNQAVARQMLLRAGIYSVVLPDDPGTFIHRMETFLRKEKWIKKGSRVAYLISTPSGEIQLIIR